MDNPFAYRSPSDPESIAYVNKMYEDRQGSRSNSRDRHRRSPSRSPSQDYSPHSLPWSPPRGPAAERKLVHDEREWDTHRNHDLSINRDDYPRNGRSRSPRRGGRGGYRDRDREGYRSPNYKSRSRSRSRGRARSPYYGGPPSRDVILEGLPIDMGEDDIFKELKRVYQVEGLDAVRVIRDRNTGLSRQFAFCRFSTVLSSTTFLERNYPSIYLGSSRYDRPGPYNVAGEARIRIAFSRERDDRDRPLRGEEEWKCRACGLPNYARRVECFRCQAPRTEVTATGHLTHNKPSHFTNSGDSDVSPDGVPSQFLLIRGLEPGVNEELLAKGIAKLYKVSGGTSPGGTGNTKKQGAKIASTTADTNLGAKEGSVKRVLLVKDRHTDESWRYGFAEFASAEDSQAALMKFNSLEKFTISSKPVLISYIHAGVFVPVYNSSDAVERFTFSPLSNPSLKLAYWDEEAYVSELLLETEDPEARAGADGDSKEKKPQDHAAERGLKKAAKEPEGKTKKRKAEMGAGSSNKKAVPAHLQFWYNRHAELHGMKPEESPTTSTEAVPKTKQRPKDNLPAESAPPTQSFADLNRNCCLLCSRQFKTPAEVDKHERLSQLHRDNMNNEELKAKALAKLAKAASSLPSTSETGTQYRDRAKERRSAFNQPTRPVSEPNTGKVKQMAEKEAADPPQPSKGAALLNKMGWTEGAGLGAQGTGMLAPIPTEMYVQGVGLGAAGGKLGDAMEEATRKTRGGYSEFLERTRDKAKERFEGMG